MQTVQKILPKYTIALGVIFMATVIYLVTRGNTVYVDIHQVRKTELIQAIYATGYVDAERMAELRSELSGTVGAVMIREGERVDRGGAILEFEERQPGLAAREARAAYAEQKSETDDLRLRLSRNRNLFRAGAISRQDLDNAEKEFRKAVELLEQRELQLKSRRDDLKKLVLTAPVSGILTMQDARAGDHIVSGTHVATVVDTASYVLNVEVDELDAPRVRPGQLATVAFDALPESRFEARVSRVVPRTDRITKTSRVYLEFTEPVEGIQAGMTATANIVYSTRENALLIPKSAIFEEFRKKYVWKIEERHLKKQEIATGAGDLTHIEVVRGIAEGDSVVVGPEERFREGLEAKPAGNGP